MKRNIVKMSLAAAMLLSSGAYAGFIKTDANLSDIVISESTQFGFGGWNLDNVAVRITDLDYNDLTTPKLFNENDGTYDAMIVGNSFESEITTDSEHRGNLHGKDWPVGEPAGIKIINGDTNVKHGKPENCIMTSSYLDTGYLDTDTPEPVICSSDWQTHKRFKVNLLESSVDTLVDGYGERVDLVFNLDTSDDNAEVVRYQVLQKINNYTGKRLDGYKIEVLDGTGAKNANLTLSIGIGEGDENDDGIADGDIWEESELANMSHGLWGPVQKDRFDNGFFDYIRAYYPVELSVDKQTISYSGEMQGGNYQQIFGNWLPSIWEPIGMFYDHDANPDTDAELQAFFGVAPGLDNTNPANLKWWTRTVEDPYGPTPIYIWSEPTVADMARWSSGALYETGPIEDVLNLGLNYIVNVGKNADIGTDTFIIRITPHVDADQDIPVYVGKTPPSTYLSSAGTVAITPEPVFKPGTKVTVSVGDLDLNLDDAGIDDANVTVISALGDEENLTLRETDVNSSVFTKVLETGVGGDIITNDGNLTVGEDIVVTAYYTDENNGSGVSVEVNASTIAHTLVPPTADAGEDVTVAEGGTVTITGIGTVDPYSDYTYYEWKDKVSNVVFATTASFNVPTTLAAGTYTLTFKVSDVFGKNATDDMNLTVTPVDNPSSGGGGGCTYNPNSKNFDMTFLLMMALGLLYPFRRRFIK